MITEKEKQLMKQFQYDMDDLECSYEVEEKKLENELLLLEKEKKEIEKEKYRIFLLFNSIEQTERIKNIKSIFSNNIYGNLLAIQNKIVTNRESILQLMDKKNKTMEEIIEKYANAYKEMK